MSNYGPPPDPPTGPDRPGPDEPGPDQPEKPGRNAPEPPPYNPYPDQWDAPRPGGSGPPSEPYGRPPYGQDPNAQNPWGQPNPYGQPPRANPYAAAPGQAAAAFGFAGYASWIARVAAYVIDSILGAVAAAPLWVGYGLLIANATTTTNRDGTTQMHFHNTGAGITLIWIGALTALAFNIWNLFIRQGRTGASYGKSVLAIRLVDQNLQPVGAFKAFLRQLCHILDAIPCYIGYLWPLWDARNQTFADKIVNTFVISATEPQQRY